MAVMSIHLPRPGYAYTPHLLTRNPLPCSPSRGTAVPPMLSCPTIHHMHIYNITFFVDSAVNGTIEET